jgi:membrane-associated protease RseP (regulator of RpoE activity)
MRQVSWRTANDAVFVEAKALHRPLFVLFACPKEKRAAPILRAENPALTHLLTERFLPVHYNSLKGIDLSLFPFDYEQQLMGLVLTPLGTTLARWGGHDGNSVASLVAFLKRVQAIPWPKEIPPSPSSQTLAQRFPRFARTPRADEACYHCHYAHDAAITEQLAAKTFQKLSLYRYPPPSVLGLTLGDDNQILVLAPGSPAQKAGLHVGERLARLNDKNLYSAADLSYALDALPAATRTLSLNGKRLTLPKDWRTYDISSRPSQGLVPPLFGFWEEPVPGSKTLALKVSFLFISERWRASQGDLKVGDIIIAVDGKTLSQMSAPHFHTWLRMNKEVGQNVALTVLRDGKRLVITLPCLALDG